MACPFDQIFLLHWFIKTMEIEEDRTVTLFLMLLVKTPTVIPVKMEPVFLHSFFHISGCKLVWRSELTAQMFVCQDLKASPACDRNSAREKKIINQERTMTVLERAS